ILFMVGAGRRQRQQAIADLLMHKAQLEDVLRRRTSDLQESEERFRNYMDNSPGIAWIKNEAGKYVYLSKTYEVRFNVTLEKIRGKTDADLFFPDIARTNRENDLAVLSDGRPRLVVEETRDSAGRSTYWLNSKFLIHNASGEKFVAGYGVDITEQKKIEEALRLSEQHFRLLFETMLQGAVYQDAEGKIISMNPAAEQILGKAREEILGSSSAAEENSTVRADGTPFPGREHPAMVALRTGEKVRDVVMGYYSPHFECYRWIIINAVPLFQPGEKKPYQVYTVFSDITERKLAEAALQNSEERYRRLVELSPDAVLVNRSNRVVFANPAALTLFGATGPDQLLGKTAYDLFHPAYYAQMKVRLGRLLRGDSAPLIEEKIIRLDGEIRDVEVTGSGFIDQEGPAIQVILRDITERKVAENALQASEFKYKTLMESIHDTFIAVDREFRYTYWNKTAEEISGIPAERVLGKTRVEIFGNTEDTRRFVRYCAKAMETQCSARYENEITFGKRKVVFDVRFFPLQDGVAILGRDITERIMAEKAMRLSEERFRTLAESLPDLILRFDKSLRVVYVNPAVILRTGLEPEAILGRTIREYGGSDMVVEAAEAAAREVLATGEPCQIEHVSHWRGETRIFESQLVPEFDPEGGVRGVITIGHDITERKQAEAILERDKEMFASQVRERSEELLAAQVELEKSKRLSDIGALAATVAHELRNPLAAIGMAVLNINKKSRAHQEFDLEKYTALINKKIAESDQIINNLLFYSRLKPPHYEKINVFELVEECVETVRAHLKKKVAIINRIEAVKAIMLEADATQIKEVFHNLLNNAIDAAPAGKGEILIEAVADAEAFRLSVKDNGDGFEPEALAQAFDPFFTTKAKGTGLGLPVCRQIVQLHGGSIEIRSQVGLGTEILVRLPMERGEHA
ncbi:MAG: PAS domain S-box protein, partial [Candidatus Firestonebacteria bacterium]|nr:PAS domain S-box protein [Candidatus Firestonebacteria bacterium]